jgi:phytoene dehydrogenase-like protein
MRGFGMPMDKAFELYGFLDFAKMMLKMGRYMKDMNFCSSVSVVAFTDRFSDPLLRDGIRLALFDPTMTPLSLVVSLSLLDKKTGGFPAGGSLEFARAIERRALGLGAKFHYNRGVAKVLVRDGRAAGVGHEDGTEVAADRVISAADLKTTLWGMLDGRYVDPQHRDPVSNHRVFASSVQVSFGVNLDLGSRPECVGELFRLETPIVVGRDRQEWLMIKNYCFDPSLAPKGKSVVVAMHMSDDFAYWSELRKDRAAYAAEKERIAAVTTEAIDRVIPGFADAVEVVDVATPATYARYTGSWKGSCMTWVQTPETSNTLHLIKKTVPGLEGFWLAGMQVMAPGGVPTGAKSARDVVEMMCRKHGKRFRATEP